MFRIEKHDIDAFVAHEERAFEARVVQRLRENFARMRGQSDDALTAFVRLGKQRAAQYGIDSPHGVSM